MNMKVSSTPSVGSFSSTYPQTPQSGINSSRRFNRSHSLFEDLDNLHSSNKPGARTFNKTSNPAFRAGTPPAASSAPQTPRALNRQYRYRTAVDMPPNSWMSYRVGNKAYSLTNNSAFQQKYHIFTDRPPTAIYGGQLAAKQSQSGSFAPASGFSVAQTNRLPNGQYHTSVPLPANSRLTYQVGNQTYSLVNNSTFPKSYQIFTNGSPAKMRIDPLPAQRPQARPPAPNAHPTAQPAPSPNSRHQTFVTVPSGCRLKFKSGDKEYSIDNTHSTSKRYKLTTNGQPSEMRFEKLSPPNNEKLPPPSNEKPWHEVLGLEPNANFNEVRKKYHQISLKWHPDKNPPEKKEEAHKKFIEIKNAYERAEKELKLQT